MLRLGEPDVDPTWPLILALSVPCAPSSPDGRAASSSCAWGSGWTRVLMWTPRARCRPGTRGRPGYRIRGPAITPSARALPAGAFAPRWLFEAGAGFYGWMTAQDAWRQSCHRLVERLPSTGRPKKIVDLGCGPGIVALELARRRPQDFVSGVDVAGRMLERARRHAATRGRDRARLTWIQADATRMPFKAESIDAVTGHSVLYLLTDPGAALAECLRVLRPGGRLLVMEPSDRSVRLRELLKL